MNHFCNQILTKLGNLFRLKTTIVKKNLCCVINPSPQRFSCNKVYWQKSRRLDANNEPLNVMDLCERR